MNPFDYDIIYLWSQKHSCFVSGNLRTQEYSSSFIRIRRIGLVMKDVVAYTLLVLSSIYEVYTEHWSRRYNKTSIIMLPQFVVSRWMDSVHLPSNSDLTLSIGIMQNKVFTYFVLSLFS